MKKVLLLGSSGMLGHVVYYYLSSTNKYQIVDTSHSVKLNDNSITLDVTDKMAVESLIKKEKPDLVINCVGILIQGSQKNPSNAIYINSYFPHQLSKVLRETGGKLIHISTDCVFSGNRGSYIETDFRDADDIYGRSKALGEVINDQDLTLRTSIIGPELKETGEGLFHWFMKQSVINGYTTAFWGGVTTLELAKVIDAAIDQNVNGLMHITNGERISKFNLLKLIREVYNKTNIQINSFEGKRVDKSLISARNDFHYNVSSYKNMLEDQYDMMLANKEIYTQYFSY